MRFGFFFFLITMAIYIFNCHSFGVISNNHPTLVSLAVVIPAIYCQNVKKKFENDFEGFHS